MNHYDLSKTDRHPNVVRYYTLNAMHECGILECYVRQYANLNFDDQRFPKETEYFLKKCNKIYEQKCLDESRTAKYRQTAIARQADILYDLRGLLCRCVDEQAYKDLKKAMRLIENIDSEAFAEDKNGNTIQELMPAYKPHWKD